MRIALTCKSSPWSSYSGGGQRSTHELATALACRGHDTNVVFTRSRWSSFPVPETRYTLIWADSIELGRRGPALLRLANAMMTALKIRRLHQLKPLDVLHGNDEEVFFAARWASQVGVPLVVTPRYPDYPAAMFECKGSILAFLRRLVIEKKYLMLADAVKRSIYCCPTSLYSAEQVERALGAQGTQIQVIPNGVSDIFFAHSWEASSDTRPLLFFGRLATDKGVDDLLRALASLRPEQFLTVIGRGEGEQEFKALAEQLGIQRRVVWRPWVDQGELAYELSRCSMAVLPSHHESFGNAIVETMAVGAPLISTSAGSIPEIVKHGKTGLLVAPRSPKELVLAIHRLLDDPELCQRLGHAARQSAKENYRWLISATHYEALYRSAIRM